MKYLPWLILIIGGAVVWMLWPDSKAADSRILELEEKNARREQAIHSLQGDYEKLKIKSEADRVAFTDSIQTYKDRDKVKSREIARIKANPVIVKVREEVKEVDSLIVAYDSLLQSKDEQIELQARYIDTLQIDLTRVTDNFMERLALQDSTIQDQKSIIEDQRKTIRKERRQKRLAKILVPVVAVGAFLLGASI